MAHFFKKYETGAENPWTWQLYDDPGRPPLAVSNGDFPAESDIDQSILNVRELFNRVEVHRDPTAPEDPATP